METLQSFQGLSRALIILTVTWLGYQLLKMMYNISPLHPLSSIPGPKLAAASFLPEFYYDLILHGRYTMEIGKMHEIYGKAGAIQNNRVLQ